MTPRGPYRRLLERHLRETPRPRRRARDRLDSSTEPHRRHDRSRRDRRRPGRSRSPRARSTSCAARGHARRSCSRTPRTSARPRRWRSPPTTRSRRSPRRSATPRPPRSRAPTAPTRSACSPTCAALIPQLAGVDRRAHAGRPDRRLRRAQRRPGRRAPERAQPARLATVLGLRARRPQPAHGRRARAGADGRRRLGQGYDEDDTAGDPRAPRRGERGRASATTRAATAAA